MLLGDVPIQSGMAPVLKIYASLNAYLATHRYLTGVNGDEM
eukprot:gene6801-3426_t